MLDRQLVSVNLDDNNPIEDLESPEWTRREFLTQVITASQWLIRGRK